MLWRARKRTEAPIWAERFGRYSIPIRRDGKRIWFHAVSVGEVLAALPVLRGLRERLPEHEILLSVTTSSGHKTAREQAVGLYDHLVYFPIDVPRFQLAAMTRVLPSVAVIMETELWMDFLWAAKTVRARTMLVNGRISDRSFPRSMRLRFLFRALLRMVDRCLMQTDLDVERIKALGAQAAERLGNTKFDQAIEGLEADPAEWRKTLALPEGRPVVVIGSTRGEEEEALVLEAVKRVGLDRIAVVHAPRHLERVPALVEEAMRTLGTAALRSAGDGGEYVVLDTYGELSRVYGVADVVVIGGGFANLGGQNLLQALAHGKPVLHGPHMQNFAEVATAALRAGASRECADVASLAEAITDLLDHPDKRAEMGAAAKALVQTNLGASARYVEEIAREAEAYGKPTSPATDPT